MVSHTPAITLLVRRSQSPPLPSTSIEFPSAPGGNSPVFSELVVVSRVCLDGVVGSMVSTRLAGSVSEMYINGV